MTLTKESQKIHYLWFERNEGRWHIGEYGLHCGDCFQVLVGDTWYDVRIEHASVEIDHGWYLIGAPWQQFPNSPSIYDLPARRHES